MKKIQLFSLLALLPALVFAQAPTPVFVTSVQKINFVDEIEALGTLSANEHVDLTSSVTERITAIHFDSGQRVSKGKRLLEMNTAEQAALLAQEKAVMNEAQRQIERLQPLMERGAASQSAMDNAVL